MYVDSQWTDYVAGISFNSYTLRDLVDNYGSIASIDSEADRHRMMEKTLKRNAPMLRIRSLPIGSGISEDCGVLVIGVSPQVFGLYDRETVPKDRELASRGIDLGVDRMTWPWVNDESAKIPIVELVVVRDGATRSRIDKSPEAWIDRRISIDPPVPAGEIIKELGRYMSNDGAR